MLSPAELNKLENRMKYVVGITACLASLAFAVFLVVGALNRDSRIVTSREDTIRANAGRFKVLAVYGKDVPGFVPFHSFYTDCALQGLVTGERVQADCVGKVPVPGDIWSIRAAGTCWHTPYYLAERLGE